MFGKKQPNFVSEKVFPQPASDETVKEALKFYRQYKEIAEVTEKIDIAMGRKKIYKYSSGSTKNCEINYNAIPPTTASYKI